MFALTLGVGIWFISNMILSEINPPYHLLEDDKEAYVMNTENIFIATIISILFMIIVSTILFVKKK